MPKRILRGTVTSDKNDQTVTVSVERRFTHPVLKKTIRKSKKYRAHDAQNQFKVGDEVRIQECACSASQSTPCTIVLSTSISGMITLSGVSSVVGTRATSGGNQI